MIQKIDLIMNTINGMDIKNKLRLEVCMFSSSYINTSYDKVKIFNIFTEDNDPYGEHDFGCFDYHGQQIFWKIDMYDLNYEYYSPNPELEEVTNRVLTVMFASEY